MVTILCPNPSLAECTGFSFLTLLHPVYNFGLSECNRGRRGVGGGGGGGGVKEACFC